MELGNTQVLLSYFITSYFEWVIFVVICNYVDKWLSRKKYDNFVLGVLLDADFSYRWTMLNACLFIWISN